MEKLLTSSNKELRETKCAQFFKNRGSSKKHINPYILEYGCVFTAF